MIYCRQTPVGGQTLACLAVRPTSRGASLRLTQQRLPSFLIHNHTAIIKPTAAAAMQHHHHCHDAAVHPADDDTQATFAHLLAAAFRRYSAPLLSISAAMLCCMLCFTHGGGVPFASATAAKQLTTTQASSVAMSSAWAGLAAGCLHTLAGSGVCIVVASCTTNM